MSRAKELLALTERCERATEADRDLDAVIWLHLPEQEPHAWKHGADKLKHAHQIAGCGFVPEYTASLDAAMTLVPDNIGWWIAKGRRWGAGCGDDSSVGDGGRASTPALALCAAALRARAAMEQPQ